MGDKKSTYKRDWKQYLPEKFRAVKRGSFHFKAFVDIETKQINGSTLTSSLVATPFLYKGWNLFIVNYQMIHIYLFIPCKFQLTTFDEK